MKLNPKKGDRVILITSKYVKCASNPYDTHTEGTVTGYYPDTKFCYDVVWDNGTFNTYEKGTLKIICSDGIYSAFDDILKEI